MTDRPESTRSGLGTEADSVIATLRVLRKRWWVVTLVVLAGVGIAFGVSSSREAVYESTASVLFGQSQLSDTVFGIQRESSQPEREAATQVVVATSSEVTNRALRALGSRESATELVSQITVEAAENADVLSFTASAETPRGAAAIANAYAQSYVGLETQQLDGQIRALEEQLGSVAPGANRTTLEQRRSTLQSLRSAANGQARLIGAAEAATAPASPKPRRDAILGAIFGLIFGVGIVFVIDLFDRRVRTVEEFEQLFGLRAVASIPQISFTPRTREERAVGFESYRILRNALDFAELTRSLDVLMVTSAVPSEGKSTVATNLARALALSGERIVLVEADLRRPSLARSLGIPHAMNGLTTALVRRRPVAEFLHPFPQGPPNLSLLPAGLVLPNAAELLRSPRMGEILTELRAEGARVIIDAPPLLPVADAQGLLDHPQIEGALLVSRTMHTTRDECRRTRAVLDQHRLEPLGVVVTGVEQDDVYGVYSVDPGDPDASPLTVGPEEPTHS